MNNNNHSGKEVKERLQGKLSCSISTCKQGDRWTTKYGMICRKTGEVLEIRCCEFCENQFLQLFATKTEKGEIRVLKDKEDQIWEIMPIKEKNKYITLKD